MPQTAPLLAMIENLYPCTADASDDGCLYLNEMYAQGAGNQHPSGACGTVAAIAPTIDAKRLYDSGPVHLTNSLVRSGWPAIFILLVVFQLGSKEAGLTKICFPEADF